ncbi:hypothetical protein [Nonomuraea sp. KM90]|uniref:hypothetical protein n=1 Tax=Nonomuraea sp. KM90 TaxID=3457428 RepID=UPI003FCE4A93
MTTFGRRAVRPAFDLTVSHEARAFLWEESPNTQFVPAGNAVHDVRAVTNVYDLTSSHRLPGSYRPSGDEALAALTLLAGLRDWLAEVEPALIEAAREAGVTWEQLAPVLRVGDRRAAQRQHARRRNGAGSK